MFVFCVVVFWLMFCFDIVIKDVYCVMRLKLILSLVILFLILLLFSWEIFNIFGVVRFVMRLLMCFFVYMIGNVDGVLLLFKYRIMGSVVFLFFVMFFIMRFVEFFLIFIGLNWLVRWMVLFVKRFGIGLGVMFFMFNFLKFILMLVRMGILIWWVRVLVVFFEVLVGFMYWIRLCLCLVIFLRRYLLMEDLILNV